MDIATIKIDGKDVKFKASAAIPRMYRIKFGRDIIADMAKLEKKIDRSKTDAENLSVMDLTIFENIAFLMAKHAGETAETPEEWLDKFKTFSIYEVLPKIIELWGYNLKTTITPPKINARSTGK